MTDCILSQISLLNDVLTDLRQRKEKLVFAYVARHEHNMDACKQLARYDKIEAIKQVRRLQDVSLVEAKRVVDGWITD